MPIQMAEEPLNSIIQSNIHELQTCSFKRRHPESRGNHPWERRRKESARRRSESQGWKFKDAVHS